MDGGDFSVQCGGMALYASSLRGDTAWHEMLYDACAVGDGAHGLFRPEKTDSRTVIVFGRVSCAGTLLVSVHDTVQLSDVFSDDGGGSAALPRADGRQDGGNGSCGQNACGSGCARCGRRRDE